MAEIIRAHVRGGIVLNVYRADEEVIAEKLAPIAHELVPCDASVAPGFLYDGTIFIDPTPVMSVRKRRREEYFSVLKVEPDDDPLTVLGDQVDKLIAQVFAVTTPAQRTAEFSDLVAKISAVKAKLPKPPPA